MSIRWCAIKERKQSQVCRCEDKAFRLARCIEERILLGACQQQPSPIGYSLIRVTE